VQVLGDGEDVFDRAAEAVEFPDAERVAGSQVVQCRGEAGVVGDAVEIFSSKIRPQPASVRASCWSWRSWLSVDTRARPTRL
jgi:hypothetical protein